MYYNINIDKLAMTNTCASVEFPHYGIWYDLLFVFQMWLNFAVNAWFPSLHKVLFGLQINLIKISPLINLPVCYLSMRYILSQATKTNGERDEMDCKCSIFSQQCNEAQHSDLIFRGTDTRDIYDGFLALCICLTGFVILSWSGLSIYYNHRIIFYFILHFVKSMW